MFKSRVRFFDSVANTKIGCHSGVRASALAALLVAGSFSSAQLHAEESEGEWEFMIAPLFLWGMSIDGESAIDGNALPLDLDFTDDIMENLDAVFRYMNIDYASNSYSYDAEQQGPLLGISIYW